MPGPFVGFRHRPRRPSRARWLGWRGVEIAHAGGHGRKGEKGLGVCMLRESKEILGEADG